MYSYQREQVMKTSLMITGINHHDWRESYLQFWTDSWKYKRKTVANTTERVY